ncbi:MAG: peroxiredoxin family protein [Novosphingobium sp.]|nr:peroxiredoxin family protein [Novosphingobium sp.]MCP5403904.1 peroxiredoxin family protein [Novosphingobium sp.]
MSKKRIFLYIVGAVVLVIGGLAAWMLGPALLPPKNIEVGVAVGEQAPVEMDLLDSAGQPATLAANLGEQGMVLVMVRSADWCPFCKAQLMRTNDIRDAISGKGYTLASLSYDKPEILAEFIQSQGIGYVMLSDPGSKMIDALGLRDPQYEAGSFAYGVPRASILVLAPDGTVKAKYVAEDYRSRPSNEEVLAMVEGVSGEAASKP